ncbi:hypothetical protein MFLAVUS_001372 [Mucor flavus]|uniref:Uncharacterized protein n=1 Tax=Mucor flavus TaxID=439312 RepID=A0ABP9YM99_9FUNG
MRIYSHPNLKSIFEKDYVPDDYTKNNYSFSSVKGQKLVMDTRYHYSDAFDRQKEQILPFELCIKDNEMLIYTMSNEHLITSIIEIWALTQFHDLDTWTINPAWYNWVILDISRRINHLGNRNNSVDSRPENNEIDGIRFDKYPLFCSKKRARLILLATTYGDSVCGLSEFIDFLHILHMSDDEFDFFFKDLQKPKWNIRYRIQLMASLFQSEDPSGPFS